jgi:Leucine-rich repeat (LRR) protein
MVTSLQFPNKILHAVLISHVHDTCPAGDSLQKLNLNDNPISELDEDSFRGLLLLRELNISAVSHLRRIGPSTFTHLRSLEILFCSYNHNLTEIDKEAFGYGDNEWTLREVPLAFFLVHYPCCIFLLKENICKNLTNWPIVILSNYIYIYIVWQMYTLFTLIV